MLIMQTGSIEITNINVDDAMKDTNKRLEEYQKEWFNQTEEDSKDLYKIAEKAIKQRPGLKVVIVKRLPRFDHSSQDVIGIKAKLSTFGNSVLDQQWIKSGSPSNIKIVELKLNAENSRYLRNLIFGDSAQTDGIHANGPAGSRHFTYRAVQAVKQILDPDIYGKDDPKYYSSANRVSNLKEDDISRGKDR